MDLIIHPGTGTIMASRECVRLSAAYLEAITDNDDEDVVLDCAEKHGTPVEGPSYFVMSGTPFDGYNFYGPFWDWEDAHDWVDRECGPAHQWFVITPTAPGEE